MIEKEKEESEFSESKIEKEYNSINLNILERKGSYNILMTNNLKFFKEEYKDDEFEPLVEEAFKGMEKTKAKETGEVCPNCGNPMVTRKGKYGEFEACSNYPACKYIKPTERANTEICNCPKCDGKIIEKKTKRGKVFYGCSNYPKCDQAYWDKPTGETCPNCGGMLLEKGKTVKCSNCDYEK